MVRAKTHHSPESLTPEEGQFLRLAERMYRANQDWFDFESFVFGMESPLFKRTRSHLNVLQHPLYIALKEMWIALGKKQGYISEMEAADNAERWQTTGSRPTNKERNVAKKRDVASANSSVGKRLSKSRG